MLKLTSATAFASLASAPGFAEGAQSRSIPQYDIFEVALKGPAEGNPFVDVQLGATLSVGHRSVTVDGFYDGDGVYKIRFMPDALGEWSYSTTSSAVALNGKTGRFASVAAEDGNHGPVSVTNIHHFAYAD